MQGRWVTAAQTWTTPLNNKRGVVQSRSPNKLRTELDLARSCDRWRFNGGIAWNVCSSTVDQGRRPGTKIRPVEQIEGLNPELDFQFFAQQIVVFEQRKIEIFQARGAQRVASEIA